MDTVSQEGTQDKKVDQAVSELVTFDEFDDLCEITQPGTFQED